MSWNISSFMLFLVLCFSCQMQDRKRDDWPSTVPTTTSSYASTKHLIEVEELVQIIHNKQVKVIDFRKTKAYDKEHLEGAINIWRSDIESHTFPYKGMIAQKDSLEALFSKLGIKQEDLLVVYDDKGSCDAARFWWVLQQYDYEAVKILNGGLKAWKSNGGKVHHAPTSYRPSVFRFPNPASNRFAVSSKEMMALLTPKAKTIILDTRTRDEYSGKRQKNGASYGGRIPRSRHIDWVEAVDYEGTQKFKTKAELERIYSRLAASKDHPIVAYCHTGVRSAHTTFVLTQLLGYKNVRNYDGSWCEWSYFDDFPFERDSVIKQIQ